MNIFLDPASPSSFDGFFTMLAAEHFIPTIIVSVLLMVCCGYYLHKFADDQPQWRSVVAFLVMLVLMLMLFTLVEVRCEYNEAKSLAAETKMQYFNHGKADFRECIMESESTRPEISRLIMECDMSCSKEIREFQVREQVGKINEALGYKPLKD